MQNTDFVPTDDKLKVEQQPLLTTDSISQKINQYEDRKRQKIQLQKDLQESKALDGCTFAPQLTSKTGRSEKRDINKFLEDQAKFEELKRQKAAERSEEFLKQ